MQAVRVEDRSRDSAMCEDRRGRREEKRREAQARIAIAKKEEALPSGTLAGKPSQDSPSVSLRSTPLRAER